jgi:uncharacterized membrane protein YphA (DoxX/SURF4 family)
MAWLRNPWVVRGCQLLLGVVFVTSGLAKLGDLHSFAVQIHNFRMLPIAVENLLAMSLPWIEFIAGLALVLGIRARSGAAVAAGLTAVFTVAVALAAARGLDIGCGCFGTSDATRVGTSKLLQNGALLLLALVGTLRSR